MGRLKKNANSSIWANGWESEWNSFVYIHGHFCLFFESVGKDKERGRERKSKERVSSIYSEYDCKHSTWIKFIKITIKHTHTHTQYGHNNDNRHMRVYIAVCFSRMARVSSMEPLK